MSFKKIVYITLFTLLGGMVGFLLHAFIEVPILAALIQSSEGMFLGLTFDAWAMVHAVGAPLLALVGFAVGLQQGKYWWKELYVKTQHRW